MGPEVSARLGYRAGWHVGRGIKHQERKRAHPMSTLAPLMYYIHCMGVAHLFLWLFQHEHRGASLCRVLVLFEGLSATR